MVEPTQNTVRSGAPSKPKTRSKPVMTHFRKRDPLKAPRSLGDAFLCGVGWGEWGGGGGGEAQECIPKVSGASLVNFSRMRDDGF